MDFGQLCFSAQISGGNPLSIARPLKLTPESFGLRRYPVSNHKIVILWGIPLHIADEFLISALENISGDGLLSFVIERWNAVRTRREKCFPVVHCEIIVRR